MFCYFFVILTFWVVIEHMTEFMIERARFA